MLKGRGTYDQFTRNSPIRRFVEFPHLGQNRPNLKLRQILGPINSDERIVKGSASHIT